MPKRGREKAKPSGEDEPVSIITQDLPEESESATQLHCRWTLIYAKLVYNNHTRMEFKLTCNGDQNLTLIKQTIHKDLAVICAPNASPSSTPTKVPHPNSDKYDKFLRVFKDESCDVAKYSLDYNLLGYIKEHGGNAEKFIEHFNSKTPSILHKLTVCTEYHNTIHIDVENAEFENGTINLRGSQS